MADCEEEPLREYCARLKNPDNGATQGRRHPKHILSDPSDPLSILLGILGTPPVSVLVWEFDMQPNTLIHSTEFLSFLVGFS